RRSGGSASPPRGPARSWAAEGTRRWRRDRTTAEAARRSLFLLRLRLGEVLAVDRERHEGDAHLVGRLLAPPHGTGRIGGIVRVVRGVVVPRLDADARPARQQERLLELVGLLPVEIPVPD